MSSSHNFDWGPYGNFQWKQSFGGSEIHLFDSSRRLIATSKIKSKSVSIEVLVPGDEQSVDMVVTTAIAKVKQSKKETKDASNGADVVDVVSAIVGA
jgi:hypothetical protein